jgi:hypothetical protein
MHLLHMNTHSRAPERWSMWTAGLIGGAIGIVVMGTLWYRQTKTQTRQQIPKRLGLSRYGQRPARSHIQLFSHPARQI